VLGLRLKLRLSFRSFFAFNIDAFSRPFVVLASGSFSRLARCPFTTHRAAQHSTGTPTRIAPSAFQLLGRSLLIAELRAFVFPEIDFITLSTSASVLLE
jgi:hypothetical protein